MPEWFASLRSLTHPGNGWWFRCLNLGPFPGSLERSEAERLLEAVTALHPDEMSPRDALEALYALKAKLAKN